MHVYASVPEEVEEEEILSACSIKSTGMPIAFPSGDKEKELWPQSDYRSKFLGEQPHSHELAKAKAGSFGGPPTITGDPRTQLGQFVTTTKSEFVGRYLPKQQIDPNLKVLCNIIHLE